MKRYLLHFTFAAVTFVVGVLLTGFWLFGLFVSDVKVEQPALLEIATPKFTFDCGNHSDVIVELVSIDGAFRTVCKSSDGSVISISDYSDTFTENTAFQTFEKVIKGASNIISITRLFDNQGNQIGKRALFVKQEKVKILKILKVDEKYFFKPYIVSDIEAEDFKNALAYEKEEKEAIRRQKYTSLE